MSIHPAIRTALLVAGASLAFAQSAVAQQGAIELATIAQEEIKTIGPDGTESVALVPAGKVVPGDRVVYTISARNISDAAAEGVVITDPIPKHMTYVQGSAEADAARIYFSVDDGLRFDTPEKLRVTGEDGALRPAGPRDYTHVRFVLSEPLLPSAERNVRFVAQLD